MNVALDYNATMRYRSAVKQIAYTRAAIKALQRMPANWSQRIRAKIEQFAADPASMANNVTEMKGTQNAVRLRIGDWRVIMEDGVVIAVLEIGPRGGIYE